MPTVTPPLMKVNEKTLHILKRGSAGIVGLGNRESKKSLSNQRTHSVAAAGGAYSSSL